MLFPWSVLTLTLDVAECCKVWVGEEGGGEEEELVEGVRSAVPLAGVTRREGKEGEEMEGSGRRERRWRGEEMEGRGDGGEWKEGEEMEGEEMEGSGRRERKRRGVEGGRGDGGGGEGGRGDVGEGKEGEEEEGEGKEGEEMEGKWKEGEGKEGEEMEGEWKERGRGRRGREGERGEGREGRGERQSNMQVGTQIYENHTRNNLHKFKKFNSWDAYHLGPRLQGAAAACVSAGILSI